jgi:hypothetical protein
MVDLPGTAATEVMAEALRSRRVQELRPSLTEMPLSEVKAEMAGSVALAQ